MFSLNVPLPGRVRREVESLRPALTGFDTVREETTLVVKRFGRPDPSEAARLESEARAVLADAPAFEAHIDGIGTFDDPPAGPAPVVYLVVESPGLEQLHARLVEAFGAVPGLEGPDYVPHVTVARGDGRDALERLSNVTVEPVTWTVGELWFWEARHGERAGRVTLSG